MQSFNNLERLLSSSPRNGRVFLLSKEGIASLVESKYSSKEITNSTVTIYNSQTKQLSQNSLYKNSKGLYLKTGSKRYYLKDFKVLEEEEVVKRVEEKLYYFRHREGYKLRDGQIKIVLDYETYNLFIISLMKYYRNPFSIEEAQRHNFKYRNIEVGFTHDSIEPIQIMKIESIVI